MDGFREYDETIEDSEIIADAYELWKDIEDYEADARRQMQADVAFANGDVWDQADIDARELDGMPCLNIPRIDQFLNHVKNGFRQSKPGIKVSAKGADSEEKEEKRVKAAERRQGLIRAIQNDSKATDAYQEVFDEITESGRGFLEVKTRYVSDNSFEQEIYIDNAPESVYMDRNHKKRDYSDSNYGFKLTTIPKEVFKAKYPEASDTHWSSNSDNMWIGSDDVTIAEMYCKWTKKRVLWQTEDGLKGYMDEIKNLPEEEQEKLKAAIVKEREVLAPYWMWYKMTSAQILDRRAIPGKYIPLVGMIGIEKRVNGKLNVYGLIRKLKDVAQLYNYAASQEAIRLSLSPKVPFIAALGQLENLEEKWSRANISNEPVLFYNPVSSGGHLAPPPQRQPPIGVDIGLIQAKQGYLDDMKAISSIDLPSMGMLGPERSGVAIKELKRGADVANLHFLDNARITITQVGNIINDWLPIYYDTDRIVKILGKENDEQELRINAPDDDGEEVTLGDGDFDVIVTMGQNFKTKQAESLDFMLELIRAAPQITPLIYDLIAKNMDAPGAQEISERLKRTIPPEILEEKGGEKQLQANLQQAVQQLQQSKELIQVLSQKLQEAMKELDDKGAEINKDLEVAKINQEGKIAVEHIKATVSQAQDANKTALSYWQQFQNNKQSTRSEQ